MRIRHECPLALGIARRSRLSKITRVGILVAALAGSVSASPPGPSPNDADHERRIKAVEQRLKALEGERSELQKQITALEKLVRESGKISGPISPAPVIRSAGVLRMVDFVQRDDLEGICDVQVSSDGKWLYSASFRAGSIAQFAIDSGGHLKHHQTITDPRLRGTTAFRIFGDGQRGVACACFAKTAVLFKRTPATGHLEIESAFTSGDEESAGLNWPVDVAVSPDSKFIYVADSHQPGRDRDQTPPGGEVTILRAAAHGGLHCVDSDVGQDRCFAGARGVLCHPNGRTLFVAAHRPGTLVVCRRDPRSGFIEVAKVFRQGESGVKCLEDVSSATLSPDHQFLYTAAGNFGKTGGIGVFRVSDDGTVSVAQQFVNNENGFRDFAGGNKIIVSPDGRSAYATATASGTLACFVRDLNTGLLTHVTTLDHGEKGTPLAGANGLAFDPTGRLLFVGCEEGNAIAVFECPRDTSSTTPESRE
jgi:sugar lactone lactonase YvrE